MLLASSFASFHFFIEINSLPLPIYACLPNWISSSLEDNRQFLSSLAFITAMTCSAKVKHFIKWILFPVFSTCIGDTCVFMPPFWSRMNCHPDEGLYKHGRKVFLKQASRSTHPMWHNVTSQHTWGKVKMCKGQICDRTQNMAICKMSYTNCEN